MDSAELATILAIATSFRHELDDEGLNVMYPVICVHNDPTASLKVNQLIKEMQDQRRFPEAAATMVWLHTLRAGQHLELRLLCRKMWKELERGMAQVDQGAMQYMKMTGNMLDISESDLFPDGMEPEPK